MTTRTASHAGLNCAFGNAGWKIALIFLLCVSLAPAALAADPAISVTPSTFWPNSLDFAHQTVSISVSNFPANKPIAIWLDTNNDKQFDGTESALTVAGTPIPPAVPISYVVTDASGSFGPTSFHFAPGVAAGAYSVRAAVCASEAECKGLGDICKISTCTPITGVADAPVTVMMGASPFKFGSGSTVTVTGYGFTGANANIWYDTDPNGQLTPDKTSITVATDGNGGFTAPLLVNGAPGVEALFAALTGKAGVAVFGDFYIHAGTTNAPVATTAINIGSCWFNDCFITKPDHSVADTICLMGNSPGDSFTFFSDCKQVDSDYTEVGSYDLKNVGPVFLGAGVLAAAANSLEPLPPGSACIAMTAAIATAEGYGNQVPDKVSLLAIDCGDLLGVPVNLATYVGALEVCVFGIGPCNHVPDKELIGGAVLAINAGAAAASVAVAAASAGALAAGPLVATIGQAAGQAASAAGVDPATASALGASVGPAAGGIVATLGVVGGAVAPIVQPGILLAAQNLLAEAAVAGAIACGYVNYYCYGSDITKTILEHADLQTKQVPIPLLQPPFHAAPVPNPCAPFSNGTCWGDIIGWSQVTCTELTASGACEAEVPEKSGQYPRLAIPGSAGNSNVLTHNAAPTPVLGPVCVDGKVLGISIGYDGDVSFDLGPLSDAPSDITNIANLVNYHNYLPGPGGSPAPGGIDIEIPLSDRLRFLPMILQIHPGVKVHVCGQWTADMHMLWNEIHPVTLLNIINKADVTAPTTAATVTGPAGTNGWYMGAVQVTLSATDPDDTHVVTTYAVDAAAGSTYSAPFGVSGDAIRQLSFFSRDAAGNQEASKALSIKIDGAAPSLQCGGPDSLWHATDASISCAANDAVSGLANPPDSNFLLATSLPVGTETADAITGSHQVCDLAGNCATAGPIDGNMIDKKPPAITIATPNGATYAVNQTVTASYSCTDGGSGVASCAGSLANGTAVPTASVGKFSLTVNAADKVGNSSSTTTDYVVAYNVCPLYTLVAKQSGSTYPIKLQLCDSNSRNVSTGAIVVHATGVVKTATNTSAPLNDSGNANPDMDFRYDASLPGYIFNLSLNGLGTGAYLLQFTAGADPTTHTAAFQVK